MDTFTLDIVSAEKELFSGVVKSISVSGVLGDLGIEPGHAPLLSPLKPGQIKITHQSGVNGYFYISGGLLEVQANKVTILADTCLRKEDLDEAAANAAKEAAQEKLAIAASGGEDANYSAALAELAQAAAQLRILKELKNKKM